MNCKNLYPDFINIDRNPINIIIYLLLFFNDIFYSIQKVFKLCHIHIFIHKQTFCTPYTNFLNEDKFVIMYEWNINIKYFKNKLCVTSNYNK